MVAIVTALKIHIPVLSSFAFVLTTGGGYATAQESKERLLRDASCDGCAIEVTPAVVWEGDWVDRASDVEVLPDGTMAFVATQHPQTITLVSQFGDSIASIGRSGEGPGEYEFISFIRSHSRLLHVFDLFHRRRTVLDGSLGVVHTNPVSVDQLWDVQMLSDHSFVANAAMLTRDRVGYALHVFNGDGVVLKSFDEPVGGFGGTGTRARHRRVLDIGDDGNLWAAYTTEYRLDHWSLDTGTLQRTLRREVDWFPKHLGGRTNNRHDPPDPRIIGIVEDSDGLLWVMIRRASARWADGFVEVPPNSHPELGNHYLQHLSVAYDTHIEVVDPRAGLVLASVIVDPALAFLSEGWASEYSENDAGLPHRQMWRLEFTRR